MSYMLILAVITLVLMVVVRFLNLQNPPTAPQLFFKDQKFVEVLAKHCPSIYDAYVPTPLWGLSGHIQTIVHAVVGRVRTRHCQSVRRTTRLGDGATLTWDEWTPVERHPDPGDYTLAVCPGIGNSSETVYIWSFVHYAALHGYRCIVLNHLGALRSVKLTSPRIFGYGRTEEFDVMLRQHLQRYPHTRLVLVGFSMGGNIVTKYMGLAEKERPSSILGAISICQGYDAQRCLNSMMPWSQLRRVYLLMMTENVKKVILRHRSVLLSDEVRAKHHLDERKIFMAATLCDLDEAYTRRVNGYDSLDDFYDDNSSSSYIPSIRQPMVFINALDDPLVPSAALRCVQQHCSSHEETLLIETEHGGHLGFFEGRFIIPEPVTWLDRTVVQLAHGLVAHAAMSS